MIAHAEARQWKLRVYSDDSAQYGQPFDWAASMQLVRPGEVEIFGIDKPIDREIRQAVICELQRLGIQRYMIARYRDGVRREIWRGVRAQ